jgi:hypothetical protein
MTPNLEETKEIKKGLKDPGLNSIINILPEN